MAPIHKPLRVHEPINLKKGLTAYKIDRPE